MIAPRATYRLQFSKQFGFASAAKAAPYLAALGVSHVYASPYLKARPGSTHGYDIVAHDELNPELGDTASFRAMCDAFASAGLKQILDFVPNHMGVGGADNPMWLEVLEWGPMSPFAGWFDIDWEPASRYLIEKLLVPVLGDQYGAVLEDGKLLLRYDSHKGEFAVWAYDTHKLPVCPLQYASILGDEQRDLERLGDEFSALMEWRPQVERRADELKAELALLVQSSAEVRGHLDRALARLNGTQDAARRELDALIQAQYWRASHFRVAGDDINYRRFFNINDLAGLRIELPEVFEHAHQLVFKLLRDGALDGLRIDHIDGLLDPKAYLQRLRDSALLGEGARRPYYLIVEKILGADESLPADWPVEGTTGYEFANLVAHLLLDSQGEAGLTRAYREFAGERRAFADMVRECKIRIMKNEMASELNVLARDAARVARQNARTADFTRHILQRAIRELIASFPVYRTYLNSEGRLSDGDTQCLQLALASARHNERDIDASVFDFLEALLTGALVAAPRSGFSRHAVMRCAMKLQQYSGPVMAKGLEDTAFYRFNRLIALNEVGGFPDRFGISVAQFHAANAERARRWPHNLLATATHDTKRGEDARTRLLALAQLPESWFEAVRRWNAALRGASAALNDFNAEYLFYQLLLGSWPVDGSDTEALRGRVKQAMCKSAREAKMRTTWAVPDPAYEQSLLAFVDAAFDSEAFRGSFLPFQQRVAWLGMQNSLVQTVLKLTVPGVPDIYQGAELWDLNLVDPDNRRAVDYVSRTELLARSHAAWRAAPADTLRQLSADWQDGAIKQLLTLLALQCRARHPELFALGAYLPAEVQGPDAERVCAFTRQHGDEQLLVITVRFPRDAQSAGDQDPGARVDGRVRLADTPIGLSKPVWRHVFSNQGVAHCDWLDLHHVMGDLPAAVLLRSGASHED